MMFIKHLRFYVIFVTRDRSRGNQRPPRFRFGNSTNGYVPPTHPPPPDLGTITPPSSRCIIACSLRTRLSSIDLSLAIAKRSLRDCRPSAAFSRALDLIFKKSSTIILLSATLDCRV